MTEPDRAGEPPVLTRIFLQLLRSFRNRARRRLHNMQQRITFYRDDVLIAPGSHIDSLVVIGRRTRINEPSYLEPCEIGSYCAIGGRLVVRSANHHMQFLNIEEDAQRRVIGAASVLGPREPVRIGHGVWIGDSVYVGPGVQIGNGAVIGAGSVVTRDIPAYAIAVGNPARVMRWRYPEAIIAELENVEWWLWDDDRMRRHRDIFELDLTAIDPADLAALLRDCT